MVKCAELWKIVKQHMQSGKQVSPEVLAKLMGSAIETKRSFCDSPSCDIRNKPPEVAIVDFPLLVILHAYGADYQYKAKQARDEIEAMELELKDEPESKEWDKANKDAVLQLKAEIDATKDDPKAPTLLTLASRIVLCLARFAQANPTIKEVIFRVDTFAPKQKEQTQVKRRVEAAKGRERRNKEAEEAGEEPSLPPYDEKDYFVDIETCQLVERASNKIVKPVEFGRLAMNRREIMHNFVAGILRQLEKEPIDGQYFPWSRDTVPSDVVWTFDYAKIETEEKEVFVPFEEMGEEKAQAAANAKADAFFERRKTTGVYVCSPKYQSWSTKREWYEGWHPTTKKTVVKIHPVCHSVSLGQPIEEHEMGPVTSHGEADPAIVKWVERLEDKPCVVISRDGDVLVILAIMMERRMRQQYGAPPRDTWTTQQWRDSDLPSLFWFRNGHGSLDIALEMNSLYNMNESMMKLHSVGWTAKRLFVASWMTKNDFFVDKQAILPRIGPGDIAAILKCYSPSQLDEVIDQPAGLQALLARIWVHKLAMKQLPVRDAATAARQTWHECKGLIRAATKAEGPRWENSWTPVVCKLDKLATFHALLKGNWSYWSLVDDKHPFQPDKKKVEVAV
jgi:hypothetical protein